MHEVAIIKTRGPNIINYCYLIYDVETRHGLVIDPGWEFHLIVKKMNELGIILDGILLTHYHRDHTNLAERFAVYYSCPVYINGIEVDFYGFSCYNLFLIREIACFTIGDFKIESIFTPGHTRGGLCFLIDGCLFTGDTLFAEGCGNCIDEGADAGDLFDSLQTLKNRIPPKTKVFPGHSFGVNVGKSFSEIYKTNIYLQLESRETFIRYRNRKLKKVNYQYT